MSLDHYGRKGQNQSLGVKEKTAYESEQTGKEDSILLSWWPCKSVGSWDKLEGA